MTQPVTKSVNTTDASIAVSSLFDWSFGWMQIGAWELRKKELRRMTGDVHHSPALLEAFQVLLGRLELGVQIHGLV